MNATVLDFHPAEPSAHDLMERALEPHILLGMPHLTPFGLSETWLMKELGHRHWLMLARQLGMENADFRTADGEEAYAAICATSLNDARFETVRANDILAIRSMLTPVSRTQVSTRHRLSVRGLSIGDMELISTFVCRTRSGDNHSIAKVPLPGPPLATFKDNRLAQTAALVRGGTLDTHFGLRLNGDKTLRSFRFKPDQAQEFNGAGLFYFAEFQALASRAVECWFPDRMPMIRRREVFFSGNIRLGEQLDIELIHCSAETASIYCHIKRDNGKIIGHVFTEPVACDMR
jgi:probable biosynthetic protein (TIGR04099 family)